LHLDFSGNFDSPEFWRVFKNTFALEILLAKKKQESKPLASFAQKNSSLCISSGSSGASAFRSLSTWLEHNDEDETKQPALEAQEKIIRRQTLFSITHQIFTAHRKKTRGLWGKK
jgi:hypothetical protein